MNLRTVRGGHLVMLGAVLLVTLLGVTAGSAALAASQHAASQRTQAATGCGTKHGLRVCLHTTGRGLVLGDMTGTATWTGRGSLTKVVISITGPGGFDIATVNGTEIVPVRPPTLRTGGGLSIGWVQNTPAKAGKYCASAGGMSGAALVGAQGCIVVR